MPRSNGTEPGDVFREYGTNYRSSYPSPLHHLKAMSAIEACRTAALGGHVDECLECGHQRISYNSCRNRCCPKCQYSAKERWVTAREDELLPVPYFHLVFTIPAELNLLVPYNQKLLYNLLFKATSMTVSELVTDPKHLGGQYGMIAVLHTWGQNLSLHPHLHCIIPGGGLAKDGTKWIGVKNSNFFLPVQVLSSLFRGKFLHLLKAGREDLNFGGQGAAYARPVAFRKLLGKLYKKKWVVYAKPPFGGPKMYQNYEAVPKIYVNP